MSAKFHLLTDAGPGWPQLPVAFDLPGVNRLRLIVYTSLAHNATYSARFSPDALVRALTIQVKPWQESTTLTRWSLADG
jgi:hypothetical protein